MRLNMQIRYRLTTWPWEKTSKKWICGESSADSKYVWIMWFGGLVSKKKAKYTFEHDTFVYQKNQEKYQKNQEK